MKTTTTVELEKTDVAVISQLLKSATLPWSSEQERDNFLLNANAEVYALVHDLVSRAYKMGASSK